MKNALVSKVFIVLFIHLAILVNGFCQVKQLKVTLIPQQTKNWCWAASMEMILNFHNNTTIKQCDLATAYLRMEDPNFVAPTDCCNSLCDADSCEDMDACSDCDHTISPYRGRPPLAPQYFHLLFSKYGFNSVEDTHPMTWQEVQTQIKDCLPFIIVLKPGVLATVEAHAVVVRGYGEDVNTKLKWLIINNPWNQANVCDGEERLISYIEENSNGETVVKGVELFVRNIYPKAENCDHCKKSNIDDKDSTKLLKIVTNSGKAFIGNTGIGGNLNNQQFQSFLNQQQDHFEVPEKFISAQLLKEQNDTHLNLNAITEKWQVSQIVHTTPTLPVAAIYERSGENWQLRYITNSAAPTEQKVALPDNGSRKVILSNLNRGVNDSSIIAYQLIKYPSFGYEFYSFKFNGVPYLAPVRTYTNFFIARTTPLSFGKPVRSGYAYKEKSVLQALKEKTIRKDVKVNSPTNVITKSKQEIIKNKGVKKANGSNEKNN